MPTLYKHPETITVEWAGPDPLPLPKVFADRPAPTLPVGRSVLRTDYWSAVGGHPSINPLVASGNLKAVCAPHRFVEGEPICMGCHFTREMAAEERAKAQAPKAKPAAPEPDPAPAAPPPAA